MRVQRVLPMMLGVLLATSPAFGGTKPVAVSPGDPAKLVRIGDSCPTFSWGETERADAYELAVYRLVEQEDEPRPVLRERIVGSASSWTPSLARCLAPGGHYVWFVRAVRDGDAEEAGGWSDGRYFATPAGPTVEDVRRALAVLAAWSQSTGDEPGAGLAEVEEPGEPAPGATSAPRARVFGARSLPTAATALRSEQPDLTGETYGVVGVVSSPQGAGVGAANLGNGPDLVLDGSAAGAVSTELSESGINRPDAADQTFTFQNSDTGKLHVSVGGNIQGITADLQELKIGGSTVIDKSGDWQGGGNTVPCASCVTSSDIADGTIIDNDLASEAVTEAKIEGGSINTTHLQSSSVTSAKILDGTVATADLATGAVTSAVIADGEVTSSEVRTNAIQNSHLADNAVSSAEILDASVASADLATGAVTSAKILDGAVAAVDLATSSVGSSQIANGSIVTEDLAPGAVNSTAILDGAIASADIGAGQVSTTHLLNMSVSNAKLASGAVTTGKVADGTLTAADVDPTGGIYASKTSVYTQDSPANNLSPGECGYITASCLDANDLALHSVCSYPVFSGLYLRLVTAEDWDNETTAASAGCEICYPIGTGGPEAISTTIFCIEVPGP